jgi:hypothetical protein
VPIVIDGSGSEHATSDSDWHSLDSFLDAEVPAAAAASGDEIEQLRLQAAAAARSYREARAAAATEAIYQAAVAPPADAQGGSTGDNARADLRLIRQEANHAATLRLILKIVLDIQKAIERMAARGI